MALSAEQARHTENVFHIALSALLKCMCDGPDQSPSNQPTASRRSALVHYESVRYERFHCSSYGHYCLHSDTFKDYLDLS